MLTNIKNYFKEMSLKVCRFTGFCHHCMSATNPYMHVCRYPLFESGIRTCWWTITLCRKDTELLYKYKTVSFSYNANWYSYILLVTSANNWCITAYREMIIDARINNWFPTKYLRLWLLHHWFAFENYTSLHILCVILRSLCIL